MRMRAPSPLLAYRRARARSMTSLDLMPGSLSNRERSVYTLTMPCRRVEGVNVQTDPYRLVTVLDVFTYREDDPDNGRTSVLWPHPRRGPWWVVLNWAVVGGRIECIGAHVRSYRESGEAWPPELPRWDEAPPVLTWETWRELPLRSIVRDIRQQFARSELDLTRWLAGQPENADPATQQRLAQEAAAAQYELAGPNAHAPSVHEEVARVYQDAWQRGDPPTQAVAKHFTISPSAAAKRVSRARTAGALPKTTRGVAGVGAQEST